MEKNNELIFNNIEEMRCHFFEEINEFVFFNNIKINFDLNIESDIFVFGDIDGHDITAKNIIALNIKAHNILADSIDALRMIQAKNLFAEEISSNSICLVENIFCESIA